MKMIVVRKLIKLHVTYLMYRTWGPSPPQATSWSKEAEQENCREENVEAVVVVSKREVEMEEENEEENEEELKEEVRMEQEEGKMVRWGSS